TIAMVGIPKTYGECGDQAVAALQAELKFEKECHEKTKGEKDRYDKLYNEEYRLKEQLQRKLDAVPYDVQRDALVVDLRKQLEEITRERDALKLTVKVVS